MEILLRTGIILGACSDKYIVKESVAFGKSTVIEVYGEANEMWGLLEAQHHSSIEWDKEIQKIPEPMNRGTAKHKLYFFGFLAICTVLLILTYYESWISH